MNNFESNFNLDRINPKKEKIKIKENENLKCNIENLSEQHADSAEKILENIGPYLDHKVKVKFLDFPAHNPGMHSLLFPQFKTKKDYDSISINTNFEDKNQIPYYLLHELGHAFESQIKETAKSENLPIYPPEGSAESEYFEDYSYGEFQADFLVGYVMNQNYVKENIKTDYQKNTYQVYEKLFANNNFEEIKNAINKNETDYQEEIIKKYESGEINKSEWLDEDYMASPIYMRAFDEKINKEYKKYFDNLEEKYQKE